MECPVCFNDYDLTDHQPHVIPCSGAHEICSHCLKLVRSRAEQGPWNCPTCRECIASTARVNGNRGMAAALEAAAAGARAQEAAPAAPRAKRRRPPRVRTIREQRRIANPNLYALGALGLFALVCVPISHWMRGPTKDPLLRDARDDSYADDPEWQDAFVVTTYQWLVNLAEIEQVDDRYGRVAYSEEFVGGAAKWRLLLYPDGVMNGGTHMSIAIESLEAPLFQQGWYRIMQGSLNLMSRADSEPHSRAAFEAATGRKPESTIAKLTGYKMFMKEKQGWLLSNFAAHDVLADDLAHHGYKYEFVDEHGVAMIECRIMVSTELGDLAKDQLEASLYPESGAAPNDLQQPWTDLEWLERKSKRVFRTGLPRV